MLKPLPHTVLLSKVNLELNGNIKTVQEHSATIYKALAANTERGLIRIDDFANSSEEEQATAVYLAVLQELASDAQIVDISWLRAARSILPQVQESFTASIFGFKPNSINVFTRPADIVGNISIILNQLELKVRPSISEINLLVVLDLCFRLIKSNVKNIQQLLCAQLSAKIADNDILHTQFLRALRVINEKHKADPDKIAILFRHATSLGAVIENAHLQPIDEIFTILNTNLETNPRFRRILQHYTSYSVILDALETAVNHIHSNDLDKIEMAREIIGHLPEIVAQIKSEAEPTIDEKLVIILLECLLPHVQNVINNKINVGPKLSI